MLPREKLLQILGYVYDTTVALVPFSANKPALDPAKWPKHRKLWIKMIRGVQDEGGIQYKKMLRAWQLYLASEEAPRGFQQFKLDPEVIKKYFGHEKWFRDLQASNQGISVYSIFKRIGQFETKKITHKDGTPFTTKEYAESRAKSAARGGLGNCLENAATVYTLLRGYPEAGLPEEGLASVRQLGSPIRIECVFLPAESGNHVFVVVNRREGSDLNNLSTWGKNCFIVDPWLEDLVDVKNAESMLTGMKGKACSCYGFISSRSDELSIYSREWRVDEATAYIGEGYTERWDRKRIEKGESPDIASWERVWAGDQRELALRQDIPLAPPSLPENINLAWLETNDAMQKQAFIEHVHAVNKPVDIFALFYHTDQAHHQKLMATLFEAGKDDESFYILNKSFYHQLMLSRSLREKCLPILLSEPFNTAYTDEFGKDLFYLVTVLDKEAFNRYRDILLPWIHDMIGNEYTQLDKFIKILPTEEMKPLVETFLPIVSHWEHLVSLVKHLPKYLRENTFLMVLDNEKKRPLSERFLFTLFSENKFEQFLRFFPKRARMTVFHEVLALSRDTPYEGATFFENPYGVTRIIDVVTTDPVIKRTLFLQFNKDNIIGFDDIMLLKSFLPPEEIMQLVNRFKIKTVSALSQAVSCLSNEDRFEFIKPYIKKLKWRMHSLLSLLDHLPSFEEKLDCLGLTLPLLKNLDKNDLIDAFDDPLELMALARRFPVVCASDDRSLGYVASVLARHAKGDRSLKQAFVAEMIQKDYIFLKSPNLRVLSGILSVFDQKDHHHVLLDLCKNIDSLKALHKMDVLIHPDATLPQSVIDLVKAFKKGIQSLAPGMSGAVLKGEDFGEIKQTLIKKLDALSRQPGDEPKKRHGLSSGR